MPDVTTGQGAIVAAGAVVSKDVPPFAVVAGNPAVIKRFRVPASLVSPLLNCQWWRYAPWQLSHLNPAKLDDFVRSVREMREQKVPVFEPTVFDLGKR